LKKSKLTATLANRFHAVEFTSVTVQHKQTIAKHFPVFYTPNPELDNA
jgi:hypothetical protein